LAEWEKKLAQLEKNDPPYLEKLFEGCKTTKEVEQRVAEGGKRDKEKAVTQGDVIVQINEIKIDKVPLKDLGTDAVSKKELLMVKVDLWNKNATKKLEYRTWAGADFATERDYATLKDNFGNGYKRLNFGFGTHPVGAVERSEALYPRKSVKDVLVFEVPTDTAIYLELELPAKNFGEEGMVRFRISMESVFGSRQKELADKRAAESKQTVEEPQKKKEQIETVKEEIVRIKKAMKDDEERLRNATSAKDRAHYQNWLKTYRERLAEQEKKLAELGETVGEDKKETAAEKRKREEAISKRLVEQSMREEKDAAASLAFAQAMIADKKIDSAIERLKKLIKEYPDTKAAKEAAELLKKL